MLNAGGSRNKSSILEALWAYDWCMQEVVFFWNTVDLWWFASTQLVQIQSLMLVELELELIQTQMTQKPVQREEVGMRVRCANKASAEWFMRGRGIGQKSRKNKLLMAPCLLVTKSSRNNKEEGASVNRDVWNTKFHWQRSKFAFQRAGPISDICSSYFGRLRPEYIRASAPFQFSGIN